MSEDHEELRAYRRRGEAFWRRSLIVQRHSGLTQSEFCRRNRLSLSTFHRWRRRLEELPTTEMAEPPTAPEFVAVNVCPAKPEDAEEGFVLELCNGARLRIPMNVESRDLVEVLWALEATGVC